MLNIAVCDDDIVFCGELTERLRALEGALKCSVACFSSADGLAEAVRRGELPDVALVDIVLGDKSGIEYVKRLFDGTHTQVIYMTSFVEYCQDVYETDHVWLLRKPFSEERLEKALRRAAERREDAERKLSFVSGGTAVSFSRDEVLYFESRGRKVMIHADGGGTEIYATIADVAGMTGKIFLQCHKSFLVNLNRVSSMNRNDFVMDGGAIVPISRGMSHAARERFFGFLGEQSVR